MFIHADDLRTLEEKVEYWCYPFLQKKGTTVIGAPPKSLKSLFTLQMMYHVAVGKPFFGWPVEQGRVLYVDFENGRPVTKERFEKMRMHFGDDHVDMGFWTKSKIPLSLDPGTVGREKLHELIDQFRPKLVVFDSLRKTMAGDENSSTELVKVFHSMTGLQETFDFTSILIHHTAKPQEGRKQFSPDNLRGSTEIRAHGEAYGIVHKVKEKPPQIDVHWDFRNHGDIEPFQLEFVEQNGIFVRRKEEPKKKAASVPLKKTNMKVEDISDGLLEA